MTDFCYIIIYFFALILDIDLKDKQISLSQKMIDVFMFLCYNNPVKIRKNKGQRKC